MSTSHWTLVSNAGRTCPAQCISHAPPAYALQRCAVKCPTYIGSSSQAQCFPSSHFLSVSICPFDNAKQCRPHMATERWLFMHRRRQYGCFPTAFISSFCSHNLSFNLMLIPGPQLQKTKFCGALCNVFAFAQTCDRHAPLLLPVPSPCQRMNLLIPLDFL